MPAWSSIIPSRTLAWLHCVEMTRQPKTMLHLPMLLMHSHTHHAYAHGLKTKSHPISTMARLKYRAEVTFLLNAMLIADIHCRDSLSTGEKARVSLFLNGYPTPFPLGLFSALLTDGRGDAIAPAIRRRTERYGETRAILNRRLQCCSPLFQVGVKDKAAQLYLFELVGEERRKQVPLAQRYRSCQAPAACKSVGLHPFFRAYYRIACTSVHDRSAMKTKMVIWWSDSQGLIS